MSRYEIYVSVFLIFIIPFAIAIQGFDTSLDAIEESTASHLTSSTPTIWHDDCSNTSSFPDLAVWYNGAMGSIDSVNGYINATDYGSASGSHGPVYYHTFQPAISIRDFNWLEAEIELDGTSAMGAAAIMLYDSDYKRIAILDVADSWSADDDAAAYAGWYDVDFVAAYTPKSHPSDTLPEPYHESLRMELNSTGLYGLIPRVGDFKMLDVGDLELDREISYLCVQFRHPDSYTPCQTMRIHDIKMQYIPKYDYTWHHDGANLAPFVNQQVHLNWYNLLNWANGTWNSSGQYLYPQTIDSASGWHGPTYVAELDQVYSLASLSNFSVAIEAINDVSSYCGKHTVYLADDDFDLILGVHVNDAWSGLQQGGAYGIHRYKNYTGIDNGPTSASPFTGINDTLSFRVEPGVGVYSYNPFYGEILLCEWNQTEFSRNVRYVILMSAQLDSYSLMPFRVHDINLQFSNYTTEIPEIDTDIPAITTLADFHFEFGSDNPYFEWIVFDENPFYYWVMLDLIPVSFGEWDGSNITMSLAGLSLGVYNFTLIVQDAYDNLAMDSTLATIEDTTSPTINHHPDLVIPPGYENFSVSWNPDDLLPDEYEIYQNGTLIESGSWDVTGIEYTVPSLEAGTYEYHIIVYDSSGNSVSDTVIVYVQEVQIPPAPLDYILIISIGSVLVIVIVIGVICRNRGGGATGPGSYDW